jgi:hypothetical protein
MADTFASDLRQSLDEIRGIAGELGLRPYTVTLRTRTWTGQRPGKGMPTETSTELLNGAGQPVRVQQVSTKDVIASGGQLSDRQLRVGPMTPAYAASLGLPAGGYVDGQIDPPLPGVPTPTDVQWIVTGPSIPPGGIVYDKIAEEATSFHYFITLRATGRAPT